MIIGQGHSTDPCVCVKCEQLLLSGVSRKQVVWLENGRFREHTVGHGDVQIALPGHLPRFVYGVLRYKNTTGLLFMAHS